MNTIVSIAAGGLGAAMQDMQRAAADIAGSTVAGSGGGDVITAMAAAINAETAFMANAAVLRRGDDMLGSLLDVFA